jgi:single-stranded-DNA-specific exonuclease
LIHDSWVPAEPVADDLRLPVSNRTLRSLLLRRGVTDEESYRRFVAPSIGDLHDPAAIHGMDHACERIARAVRDGEGIVIYGDYDVDGVTSIVLLRTVLRALGVDAGFVVPHRLVDGYGLKMEVLDRVLSDRNVGLVITVDCGITSVEPVQRAIERGIDVIVTDHHLPPGTLPDAAAVLNPRQPGCTYPFKDLAGVGVAFKLCCELIRRNRLRISIDSLMKIAAIGTVADVAPLIGENRTITSLGLAGLANVRNRGLAALLKRLGLAGRALRAVDVGFKIGPRINAPGRLASADTAIELFSAADDDSAWQICIELDRLNAERRQIEQEVRAAALAQVRGDERILVLAGTGWHRGVLGLAAGRLAQQYHRPALVISIDGMSAVGSARSIESIDLHSELESVSDLFAHFGGHEFACGFSLASENVAALRQRLEARFNELDDGLFRREARVDGVLTLGEIDGEFLAAHELLQPFGAGNLQPLFEVQDVSLVTSRTFAEECRELELIDATGRGRAVLWPGQQQLTELLASGPFDLLARIEPDPRNGSRLTVVDARSSRRVAPPAP